jgi:lycopene beta-cyclase
MGAPPRQQLSVAIVGTGVSALLLARALLEQPVSSVVLVGPAGPLRPHLLSYWSDGPTPFDACASWSWDQVRLGASRAAPLDVPLKRFRYRTFRAQPWADATRAILLRDPRVTFRDAKATVVATNGDRGCVTCDDGLRIEADWVFDSRRIAVEPDVHQRFVGWELELDAPWGEQPGPTLLDFRTPSDGDFRFAYVLPLEPTRLFVEHVSYARCDHDAALESYLRRVLEIERWRVVDREAGATPLFATAPQRVDGRVVRIGVHAAGLAKVCTGYAVMRMWRDAVQLAGTLFANGAPSVRRRQRSLDRLADRFFLELLHEEPERIPELLVALFARAPGDAVLAFLDEQAPLSERLTVARAMPRWLRWAMGSGIGSETG